MYNMARMSDSDRPERFIRVVGKREPPMTDRTRPATYGNSSEALCRSCALCCDGTIFSRVPLEPDEVASIRSMDFEVFDTENKAYLSQPCAKLSLGSCSAYAARPNNCRTFRCRVLQRLEAGELSTEQAHALVNEATSLNSTLDELLSSVGERSWGIWKRLDELVKTEKLEFESIELSKGHSRLGKQAALLQHLIDTEFRTTSMRALSARMDDLSKK